MAQQAHTYASGDWIVHRSYGVGQIKGTEVKHIGGDDTSYYRIQTQDSTLWLPVEKLDGDVLRPVATVREMDKALEILQQPPEKMEPKLAKRKVRINEVKTDHSPRAVAQILRDLWAYKQVKRSLALTEERALRHFIECFLAEWSVCKGVEPDKAKERLLAILEEQEPLETEN